ncbi:uncharacterized protein N7487_001077 [Penicillium crustosum]|uniref:uncharacterized protein n=1 Tax=Penicillium crustosum TaxID=36656 RepID=UPI0023A31FE3|nr:uncharacterized protein N7487_001077 [Penicillium crustosum]KAJ5417527.1 hypothetical protein N7487_001077 [Penicillium crustosum]
MSSTTTSTLTGISSDTSTGTSWSKSWTLEIQDRKTIDICFGVFLISLLMLHQGLPGICLQLRGLGCFYPWK